VAIARALAQRPALLLCDEPNRAISIRHRRRVLDLIMRLHEELGFCARARDPRPSTSRARGRVITLQDGRVIADAGLA